MGGRVDADMWNNPTSLLLVHPTTWNIGRLCVVAGRATRTLRFNLCAPSSSVLQKSPASAPLLNLGGLVPPCYDRWKNAEFEIRRGVRIYNSPSVDYNSFAVPDLDEYIPTLRSAFHRFGNLPCGPVLFRHISYLRCLLVLVWSPSHTNFPHAHFKCVFTPHLLVAAYEHCIYSRPLERPESRLCPPYTPVLLLVYSVEDLTSDQSHQTDSA